MCVFSHMNRILSLFQNRMRADMFHASEPKLLSCCCIVEGLINEHAIVYGKPHFVNDQIHRI